MIAGSVISHYRIVEQLGRGGMGVVYKAHDTRLDRTVALKFLPPEWTEDDEAKTRFMQEARSASGLDHPNIYTIYEIGETNDGRLFIVTPFYDGETLKYRLKSGALPPGEARDIAIQLLKGLRRAHEAAIVHRDVKPANIMVTGRGVVKLLDFGLAKLEAGALLTRTGSTLGTTAYMSPEQASGKPVDHRSDLWSAGVVLYEMLNGRRPFIGDYEQAVVYSVLNEAPPDPDPAVPPELAAVVHKLLSKNPDERFATAGDVLAELSGEDSAGVQAASSGRVHRPVKKVSLGRWMTAAVVVLIGAATLWMWSSRSDESSMDGRTASESGPASSNGPRSAIAIMPFSNLRNDPETDFLGFALADQIIGSLTYVSELLVRPSSSIRTYEDRQYDTRTAGRELAVDYILNGTFMKEGDQMRLTVELVDVASDEIIWREPVELEYENAFQLQDAVSQTVLERLEVEFSTDEQARMAANLRVDPIAYEFYLRAIAQPWNATGIAAAEAMARESVEIDSTFAPAWDELGLRLSQIGQFSLEGEEPVLEAERAHLRALRLNPDLFGALGNLSRLYTELGRILEGIRMADRMLNINPNSALGHFARGYAFRYAGRIEDSVREMREAIRLDSTDTRFRQATSTFLMAGLYNESIQVAQIDEGSAYADYFVGEALMRQGREREALALYERALDLDPDGLLGLAAEAALAAHRGDTAMGLANARRWESVGIADAEANYYNAGAYCINGDHDSCLRLLRQAVERSYSNVHGMVNDRFFRDIQDDPRFRRILDEARRTQAAFIDDYF